MFSHLNKTYITNIHKPGDKQIRSLLAKTPLIWLIQLRVNLQCLLNTIIAYLRLALHSLNSLVSLLLHSTRRAGTSLPGRSNRLAGLVPGSLSDLRALLLGGTGRLGGLDLGSLSGLLRARGACCSAQTLCHPALRYMYGSVLPDNSVRLLLATT